MTDWKHIAKIAQALADGVPLQERFISESGRRMSWRDWDGDVPLFHSKYYEYRIKPQPARQWWLCWEDHDVDHNRVIKSVVFPADEYTEYSVNHWANYVLVQEVSDE